MSNQPVWLYLNTRIKNTPYTYIGKRLDFWMLITIHCIMAYKKINMIVLLDNALDTYKKRAIF